jgi:hypothetical protein
VFEDVGFASCDRVRVRDLLKHADLGIHSFGISMLEPVPGHGVVMLKLAIEV